MNKNHIRQLIFLWTVLIMISLTGCSKNNDHQMDFQEDMKNSFDQSALLTSNIGIFSKIEDDNSISYGECGSGVIFEKNEETYYALTAAHVVSDENAQFLVFTANTEMKSESIPGFDNANVLSEETYDSMYSAELLYVSQRDDLAIISFTSEEKLSVVEIADSDPQIGDHIMCIGNPENEWFSISYGEVTSGIETFGELKGYSSYAMKHNAYIQVGSSGGAAIGESMKLVGITPGASLSLDGKKFYYGVLIPPSEIILCVDEWKSE